MKSLSKSTRGAYEILRDILKNIYAILKGICEILKQIRKASLKDLGLGANP